MKHQALPIINKLSLIGCSNEVILIETDKDITFFDFMSGKNNIIFSPNYEKEDTMHGSEFTIQVQSDSVSKCFKMIRSFDHITFDYIVINRIDIFDSELEKLKRGALIAGLISMMCSKTILRGANLLITSQKTEYKLREISTQHYTI